MYSNIDGYNKDFYNRQLLLSSHEPRCEKTGLRGF